MKKYGMSVFLGLCLFSNNIIHASEKSKIGINQQELQEPLVDYRAEEDRRQTTSACMQVTCAGTIGGVFFAVFVPILYVLTRPSTPVYSGCADNAHMVQHDDEPESLIKITAKKDKYDQSWDNISPFRQGEFNNDQEAKVYAVQKLKEACPHYFNSSCTLCFEFGDYNEHERITPIRDFFTRIKNACSKSETVHNTRSRLTRNNNVQRNNDRQPKQQKQNFRQHMRGRNKRG